jgi:hypothetical protein
VAAWPTASLATILGMLIRPQAIAMTTRLTDRVGFSRPAQRKWARERRSRVFAELITTAALALSLAVAVAAVSIGISRAGTSSAQNQIGRVL